MDTKDRQRIRSLQDKIILSCEKKGYLDNIIVSESINEPITLGDLRNFIYPEYENQLERVFDFLKNSKKSR